MTDTETLAARAASYHAQILQVACGPGGMLVSFPRFDTRRPFQEGEEYPGHWYISAAVLDDHWGEYSPRPTVAEWLYGENTLWATGWFLWSQILRFRATGEPEARETARKCFRDLHHLFRLCGQLEPGLLGKPHGGRAGPTTSFDQSACPVVFYAAYARELATPDEKAQAVEDLRQHGNYYLRRNWVMNLFGVLHRIVEPVPSASAMKYLACVYAAYQLTGDTRYRDAAVKYMRAILPMLPWPTDPYPVSHNLYYWSLLFELWSQTEVGGEADWDGHIRAYWRASQSALDDDGLIRFGHFDTMTYVFTPYPHRWLTRGDVGETEAKFGGKWGLAPVKTQRKWVSSTSMFNRALVTAMTAALGMLARSRGLDDGAHRVAKRTLLRLDDDSLRWWWDDGQLPAELKGLLNVFSPETAAVWQVAYWMGRQQRVW